MPTAPLPGRRWIAGLLLFVGLNALVAAGLFVVEPDGSAMGIPQDWLAASPFDDYLVPGLLLGSMGVLSLVAATLQLRRQPQAWLAAGVVGFGFVIWIVVQSAMMGSFRHPMQTALQALVIMIGMSVSVLAFRQYRAWHLCWGATEDEVAATLPGDDILPKASFRATRAITIDAPPRAVWPWLVQIGYGRAGFYSYDRLDNSGKASLSRIEPSLQDLKPGDIIAMSRTVNEDTSFKVVRMDPPHSMVWSKRDSSWAWLLAPAPDGATRLVTRLRHRYERNRMLPVALLLMEGADFPMMRRCLKGIKQRAEANP